VGTHTAVLSSLDSRDSYSPGKQFSSEYFLLLFMRTRATLFDVVELHSLDLFAAACSAGSRFDDVALAPRLFDFGPACLRCFTRNRSPLLGGEIPRPRFCPAPSGLFHVHALATSLCLAVSSVKLRVFASDRRLRSLAPHFGRALPAFTAVRASARQ
jgi:hypothetical protein